ncbi:hypothetical protein JRI60_27365 [Archangium violaceum]|uniref:hypothetical protein n=1 Tax=Archangium violaceum TaxID=83451 RepID=UPI00194E0F18|nr:hypothetical protein [Archangium violaceum]QRN92930.1 hypothetical protein JRI60_27365 [Archangium violaceum]
MTERLHLLLADAEEQAPVLKAGLEFRAVWDSPKPGQLPRRVEAHTLDAPGGDPNDLAAQRWGVIAPEGREGDEMLQALEPLIRHRERQQGACARRYRVPPGMDAEAAVRWRDSEYRAEDVPEEERPRYLLVLGDLHQVSIELQQVLVHSAFVGRLHFSGTGGGTDLEGHAAYARKVLASEHAREAAELPESLFYTALDGSGATEWGERLLVQPCLEAMKTKWERKHPGIRVQRVPYGSGGVDELVDAAGRARAGVMLTVSHGLGAPPWGWSSVERQWAMQGALSLGSGQVLSGDMLRSTPFLPEGIWFCLACFGAATPPVSAFHAWLEMLAQAGAYPGSPEDVLRCLPQPGQRPFLAALPQAALANPLGPLAVIGHSDLAWSVGFSDPDNLHRGRASRFLSVLETLARGGRAGVALDALMRFYREVNDSLMALYQLRQDAAVRHKPDPVNPARLGGYWMLRNDLRGYILLGDPAVRLPLKTA